MKLDKNKTSPVITIKFARPFYHGDMEVTFTVQVIPFQNMSWLKWKISNQADSGRTFVNCFSFGANPLKLRGLSK